MNESRPRLVRVSYINDEGLHLVEHYAFPDSETLLRFLDWVDEPRTPRFGGHAEMSIFHLAQPEFGVAEEPEAQAPTKRTPTKRAAKKATRKRVS